MIFPYSGRVVLIDDKYPEIKPIMDYFAKEAVPYCYFSGDPDFLPDSPLKGIRYVFLDIILDEALDGSDDKSIASSLIGVLEKIVSVDNGPYILIFWTKNTRIITQVLENCASKNISPIDFIDLGKPINNSMISGIDDSIHKKTASLAAFELFTNWENVVNEASKEFVKKLFYIVKNEEDWTKSTSNLFFWLSTAYTDNEEELDNSTRFQCACHVLNRSLLDILETESVKNIEMPQGFTITKSADLTSQMKAKLNTALFLNINNDLLKARNNGIISGYVYKDDNQELKKAISKKVFEGDPDIQDFQLSKAIITPECDIPRNLYELQDESQHPYHVHRVVFGIMYKEDANPKPKLRSIGEKLFPIRLFLHNNEIWNLIFCFSSMSTLNIKLVEEDLLFALKRDLLFDLQSKCANHVNRLGNFMIK